ncbi:hypothetical protein MTO96_037769 [Rhipicephalus appendiculatus]
MEHIYSTVFTAPYTLRCTFIDVDATRKTLYDMVWACTSTSQLVPITHPITGKCEAVFYRSGLTDRPKRISKAKRTAKAARLLRVGDVNGNMEKTHARFVGMPS